MFSGPLISAKDAAGQRATAVALDARAGGLAHENWFRAHAPGARFADLERDLSDVGDPSRGGRHPLPKWSAWLERVGSWGIDPSTPVLIYDANNGGMAAARAWWMFRAIGHANTAVVDGGWEALRRAGVREESGDVALDAGTVPYPSTRGDWPALDAAKVDRIRDDPSWTLIDARAPERYAGRVEPIDPIAGHIPGAVNLHWQSNVDSEGRLVASDELRRRFDAVLGGTPPERVVCYCGSGVTACHLLLAMEACGLSGAGLYVGSWSEWCRTRLGAIPPS